MNEYQKFTEEEWLNIYNYNELSKKYSLPEFLTASEEERCLMVVKTQESQIPSFFTVQEAASNVPPCPSEESCEMITDFLEKEVIELDSKLKDFKETINEQVCKLIIDKTKYLNLLYTEINDTIIDIYKLRNK